MNQDDVILLGELMNDIDVDDPEWVSYNKYKDLVQKVKLVAQQAKASKEYQGLMDKLNTELSELGKDDENAKN